MSVISRQCDELRGWADQLSEREGEFGVVVRAPVAAIRRAADTIIELNGALLVASRDYGRLEAENAKLRELACDMWRSAMANMDLAERYAFAGEFNERMRELGIEVTS